MKATMVEFLNDNNRWVWYRVSISKSPKQAIKDYLKEHYKPKDIKWKIEKVGIEYYYDDIVRAYRIDIEE